MITTRIWADPWFEGLDTESKLVWMYLLTNQQTNLIGVYEISLKRISNETGVELNRLQTVLDGFANGFKIIWNGSYMVICNFLKHQNIANPNMEKSADKVFNSLPSDIKKVLLSHGIKDLRDLMNGFANRYQTVTKPFGEIEREREIEIEREIESETENFLADESADFENQEEEIPHLAYSSRTLIAEENKKKVPGEPDKIETVKAELWPSFNDFWETYDKKRGDKEKLKKKWESLKQSDKEKILEYIPQYKLAQPDKNFRKDPQTFLNNKSWNDEIITSKSNNLFQSNPTPQNHFARLLEKVNRSSTGG